MQADKHAVREAQRAAVAGILATMEEHFTRHPKRSASPQPQQPPPKRSKLLDLDLGDVDFGSDASSVRVSCHPSSAPAAAVPDLCWCVHRTTRATTTTSSHS